MYIVFVKFGTNLQTQYFSFQYFYNNKILSTGQSLFFVVVLLLSQYFTHSILNIQLFVTTTLLSVSGWRAKVRKSKKRLFRLQAGETQLQSNSQWKMDGCRGEQHDPPTHTVPYMLTDQQVIIIAAPSCKPIHSVFFNLLYFPLTEDDRVDPSF